ncbi:hypothetical protein KAF25_001395 [Fusarium avenaceum]|uniref:RBR-type E3 ubiquitin transferase n=1 Tax=Fusarium avenaceum TaxID=40199 RepID=A0A9P7H779_9HYPO|nr:hypothetical protein KAF25_001395 [Fusarium avenaceum]
MEEFPETEIVEVPCGHDLCKPCIIWCVERAIAHETLFPPKCCQHEIPIEVNSFLSHDLVDHFEQKRLEYETVNRTYCSNQRCLKFIPPYCIDDDDAICNDCGTVTCATCRAAAHAGPCVSDPETLGLLALAEREGWKRCTKCGRMIELSLGCNSMQCVCGFEFCYVCGLSASVGCGCIAYGMEAAQCRHRWYPEDFSEEEECEKCDVPPTSVQICQHCGTTLCAACQRRWPFGI